MWEIDNGLQVAAFLRSVVLGVIFSFVYDVFKSIRIAFKSSDLAVFSEDVIYFVIISPVTFCFLLATTNGELRMFVFIGIIIGFFIARVSVSSVFVKLLSSVLSFVYASFTAISRSIYTVFGKIYEKSLIFFKKARNTYKKLLKMK